MIGLMHEQHDRMIVSQRVAHTAWVNEQAWKYPANHRAGWREAIANLLVALATRLAPSVTSPSTSTQATAQ
ncbi:MAG: hypothetical protein ACR2JW_17740 [Thermomicrobiales bacterium]